jgi:sugar/nucleoside kinase (ribokinase family)
VPDVGCAGILVQDMFCGPMAALPPEGALLALEHMPTKAGGCAANVAIGLAKQGVSVDVVGCLGSDSAADFLLKIYALHGVGCAKVVRAARLETSRCVILLVQGQDRRYLYFDGANRAFSIDHIDREWLSQLKVFYLGGLFVLPGIDSLQLIELLEFCRAACVTTVVDVVIPQFLSGMSTLTQLLPLIDVFVPNEDEARAFTGLTDPLDQLRALEGAGAHTVIITRGNMGAVASRDGRRWRCGAYQMPVIDPSGSGDAFASGVIRGVLGGWSLPQTLRYASAVGASVTRAAGTTDAIFSADEAESFVREHPLAVIDER